MPGEAVTAGGNSLVALSATVDIDAAGDVRLDDTYLSSFVRLTGPGTVWLQTALARHASEVTRTPVREQRPAGRAILNVVR